MDETELLLAAGCRRTAGPAKAWNVLRVKTADDATLRLPVDDLRRTTVGGVKRLIKSLCMVNCAPGFGYHPEVMNGYR